MKSSKALVGVASSISIAAGLLFAGAGGALAAGGVSVCVPEAEGSALVTPTKGACATKYKLVALSTEEGPLAGLTTAEKETLAAILDSRDSGEDSGEEQHQHDYARVEILRVADRVGHPSGPE